jgi:hyperosmotically inducible periplasmic protein
MHRRLLPPGVFTVPTHAVAVFPDNANARTGEISMNIRPYQLIFGVTLAAGTAIFVTGCNRQEPVVAAVAVPATTTVGTEIDDTVVTTKVKSALLGDQEIKAFDIKVETRKGVVLLSGFVDSQFQMDRVVSVVRAVEGVKATESGMTLRDSKVTVGNKVDDSIVTTRVKSALLSDPGVNSADIAVATSKGEVQLSGFVDSQAQIDRALVVTRAVEGTQGIVNEMSIKK